MSRSMHANDFYEAAPSTSIPEVFCWTKMGTEAGQSLDTILNRKELERRSNNGAFTWGIGNSLGRSADLARTMSPSGEVDVLFTPMRSAPKQIDVAPSSILLWVSYYDNNGALADLPSYSLITSRGGLDKRTHYALICHSDEDIARQRDLGSFDATYARNLASSNPIGASQVTSVVRFDTLGTANSEKSYKVAFRAKLWSDGFVRLANPVLLEDDMLRLYQHACHANSVQEWQRTVQEIRTLASEKIRLPATDDLFSLIPH